jgi:hypothetical protein
LAVAIIVDAIARFGGSGFDFTETGAKGSGSRDGIERTDADAIFASAFVFCRCGAGITGFCGSELASATFVHSSVAIVVEVVSADLGGGGGDFAETRPKRTVAALWITQTKLQTAPTSSFAIRTSRSCVASARGSDDAAICAVVIDLAVAVVVDAIADLRAWEDLALAGAKDVFAGGLVGDTNLDSCAARGVFVGSCGASVTRPRITGDTGLLAIFVDLAIAVIVETIAQGVIQCGFSGSLAGA